MQTKKLVSAPFAAESFSDCCWAVEVYKTVDENEDDDAEKDEEEDDDEEDDDSNTMLMSAVVPVSAPVAAYDESMQILSCDADEAVEVEMGGTEADITVCLSPQEARRQTTLHI